jgi:hypothetical protein
MVVEGGQMVENGEPAGSVTAPSTATMGVVAPSCYRVSVLSGSLEVSARLKNADDLQLLMRVLEANKVLFTKADRSEPEVSAKADRATKSSAKAVQLEAEALVKAHRPTTKTSAKANRSEPEVLAKADSSEPEVLTLT